uniref:F-box domain-containing protein n=1 Tax=Amazona collaria TaxID=241587 RepID=A0A8B9GR66_9PSIT
MRSPRSLLFSRLNSPNFLIQVAIVFGAKVLEHVLNLCRGSYDFLEQLPVPLLLYIISFLELKDIARLSEVSKICNSNALWENTVVNLCSTIAPEMKALAQEMAWNQFFTNYFPGKSSFSNLKKIKLNY